MEVHLLQCRPVNGRLSLAESLEELLRPRLATRTQSRAVDQLTDLGQCAVLMLMGRSV